MEDSEIVIKAKEKLKLSITVFLSNIFTDMIEVVNFHKDALTQEGLYDVPRIDYMKLQRFIVTAVNNLKDRDTNIQTPLFVKLYKDINVLIKFYNLYVKIYHENQSKHVDKFLSTTAYQQILAEATGTAYTQDLQSSMKTTSTIIVDGAATKEEFLDYSKHTFEVMYDTRFDSLAGEMKDIVNIKSEMFDKVFWSNARASNSIKSYFADLGVSGHVNLKTYIESYLKSIDVSKMKDQDWHQYLQNCVKYLG